MKSFKFTGILKPMACVNQWLDLQLTLCSRLKMIWIFPNVKAGVTLIEETGKDTTDEEQTKRGHEWAGANAFLNFLCGAI